VKFIIDNWMLIALAVVSGGLLFVPILQGALESGLGANDAVQLINREKAVVVDVCEPAEFAAGHIVGAKNIPLGDLQAKLAGAVKNKTLPLILVCQSGARSAKAVVTAKALGFEQAQSLGGGLEAWKAANLPVEKS
jgi:hypothetical protein